MRFSVLMSVYHKEYPEYLRDALLSIIRQTLPPNEIVLVQDGPLTDDLHAVIDSIKASNSNLIKDVVLKQNRGLGVALNEGMRACSNGVIARMDTDDIAEPDRFAKQINFMVNNEEVDMVGSNISEYDDDFSELMSVRSVPERHKDIVSMMKKRSPFNHMSVVYKKDAVLACGGYEDCPSFEDYYLWCKMAINGARFHNLQENLVRVRMGEALSTRRGGAAYIKDIVNFQKKAYSLGIFNKSELMRGVLIRSIVALLPAGVRTLFYKSVLRRG